MATPDLDPFCFAGDGECDDDAFSEFFIKARRRVRKRSKKSSKKRLTTH
jgi:hypothetical protein